VSELDFQSFFFCDKPHSLANHPNQKQKTKNKKKLGLFAKIKSILKKKKLEITSVLPPPFVSHKK